MGCIKQSSFDYRTYISNHNTYDELTENDYERKGWKRTVAGLMS